MKSWAFVESRRNLSLSHYLRNVHSIEAAMAQFKNDNIEAPAVELVVEALVSNETRQKNLSISAVNSPPAPKPKRRPKNQHKRRKPLKKDNSGEFDEIVIINTEETSAKD